MNTPTCKAVYKNAMRGGRKLASRAALLLLAIFISIHLASLLLSRLDFGDSNSRAAMSGQQALQTLKSLSPVQQRRAAAILGALLADVATAPLHWIYDQGKVKSLTEAENTVAFYPKPECPFYTIPVGSNSAYGDQVYVTLKNVAENKGFDADKLADAIFTHFGPGTVYEDARKQTSKPINGPWTNHNIKIFLANREKGASPAADSSSKDPDGLCKAVVVIGLLSGKPELLDAVEKCVKTTQSSDTAVGYALGGARILDHVIQTGSDGVEPAIADLTDPNRQKKFPTDEEVAEAIKKASKTDTPHADAVKTFGLACGMPGSFSGMVQGITHSSSFEEAVKQGILAAGDNCSRNNFIGAYAAAKYGLDSLPVSWLDKYPRLSEVVGYIETVAKL